MPKLRSCSRPRGVARCRRRYANARIVLASAGGQSNTAIAARSGLSKATVGKWRASFMEKRIAGFYDDVRPARLRSIDDEQVARLIQKTLHSKPRDGAAHCSVRSILVRGSRWTLSHRFPEIG